MKKTEDTARHAFVEEFALARVALRLADAIERSGKSQREIAKELGLTEARISQILNLKGNPTVKSLARIADAIGTELDVNFADECHVPQEREPWNVVRLATWRRAPTSLPDQKFIDEDLNEAA